VDGVRDLNVYQGDLRASKLDFVIFVLAAGGGCSIEVEGALHFFALMKCAGE